MLLQFSISHPQTLQMYFIQLKIQNNTKFNTNHSKTDTKPARQVNPISTDNNASHAPKNTHYLILRASSVLLARPEDTLTRNFIDAARK